MALQSSPIVALEGIAISQSLPCSSVRNVTTCEMQIKPCLISVVPQRIKAAVLPGVQSGQLEGQNPPAEENEACI